MAEPVVDDLEFVDINHEEREEMFRAQRAIRLALETLVEVPTIEEPRQWIGLSHPLERLALLLLHEHRADVSCEDLERLQVIHLVCRLPHDKKKTSFRA